MSHDLRASCPLCLQELKRTKKNKMCARTSLPPGFRSFPWRAIPHLHKASRRAQPHTPPRAPRIEARCRVRLHHRKEIIRTMESFNNNLQGGKKLVKALEKQTVRLTLPSYRTRARLANAVFTRDFPGAVVAGSADPVLRRSCRAAGQRPSGTGHAGDGCSRRDGRRANPACRRQLLQLHGRPPSDQRERVRPRVEAADAPAGHASMGPTRRLAAPTGIGGHARACLPLQRLVRCWLSLRAGSVK